MNQLNPPDNSATRCPVCAGALDPAFFQMRDIPTLDGAVRDTVEEARACPIGDMTLRLCGTCGWIGNATFEPDRLNYETYHFSLHHSPAFEAFVGELVDGLTQRHGLDGGRVLDVGCGAGDFLRSFTRRQKIQGLGIDPSIAAGSERFERGSVTYERGLLKPSHSAFDAELACCRHVLNSMPDPLGLLQQIRAVCEHKPGTAFYFEVPHANKTFDHDLVWNAAYEHHNWFNEISFRVLCERAGYEVLSIGPCWGDEYLGAELRLAEPQPDAVATPEEIATQRGRVERFGKNARQRADQLSQRFADLHQAGQRVAIWGAGARALLFLNQMEHREHVGSVIDINPDRQGKYLARIGVRIDAPESLKAFDPDLVMISNPAFADEIRGQIAALGLNTQTDVF